MDALEKYFKKKTEDISFMELKDKDLPLPIITDKLVKEIKMGNLEDEIDQKFFIEGMVYILGTDPNFVHAKAYVELLNNYDKPIEDYIFYIALRALEEDKYDLAAINFRALKLLYPENINAKFNYALTLEGIGQEKTSNNKEEEGLIFLQESTRELEEILDMDEDYGLAYYKLGFHYKALGYFLKAKLIWTKHLGLDKDEIRLQEIRGELELIENDVALETGLTYLSREYYDKALDSFLKLSPRMNKWWELKYLIGICYKGLLEYENAVQYLEEALELYKLDGELYNELGICLFTTGDFKKAIDVFSEGIENILEDYKLIFNRGLCYFQLGELKQAYKDIEYAESLNPYDENIKIQKEELEKIMLRGGV